MVGKTIPLAIQKSAFDNTEYRYPADDVSGLSQKEVNARVIRIRGKDGVRNVDPNFSDPSGIVSAPLMMIHTTGDHGTPISVLRSVKKAVDSRGDSDLLVQRAIRAPGHGDFTAREKEKCWDDFFAWVQEGKKPYGDDLTGSLLDVGKQFTDPTRLSGTTTG